MIRIDLYTKGVLTVIAVCLTALLLKPLREVSLIDSAHGAVSTPVDVRIIDVSTNILGMPVYVSQQAGAIPVIGVSGNPLGVVPGFRGPIAVFVVNK